MSMDDPVQPAETGTTSSREKASIGARLKKTLIGPPRDLSDRSLFHRLSLIPFLAWVGLGADGLSSSAYGPDASFRALGQHTYLAIALAAATVVTVMVISRAYSRIIEEFPHGGGGYVVATKLLGERAGVISGCALLFDYVLTIAVSIAAAGDALFSFLPWDPSWKLWGEAAVIAFLTMLNIRGVRESVMVLLPIFIAFVVTHIALIGGCLLVHLPEAGATAGRTWSGLQNGVATLGVGGLLLVFLHAYSLGGGTYTGLEAVSNGLPIMREPRVHTGKRTMFYMAISLSFTAAGLLLSYLLWDVSPIPNKTMNAALVEKFAVSVPGGTAFVILTLLSEGALLIVGAQAGFIDGPRVLANMAIDSWVPRRFAALSERLTTQNGILLMGSASLAVLLYARGNIGHLVVMYSINVFLTFSLSTFAMLRSWWGDRRRRPEWKKRVALFSVSFVLCATILAVTVHEKFLEGGWLTLCVTMLLLLLCYAIRRHYRSVARKLNALYASLEHVPPEKEVNRAPPDPRARTAAVLVAGYSGLGIHTVLNILRNFPGDFKNLMFVSVSVIDSGSFKGEDALGALQEKMEEMLRKYVELANNLGLAAGYRHGVGTDVVAVAEKLCLDVLEEFPRTTFFIGKVLFEDEKWYHRFLHNDTAFGVQKRLEWAGKPMVIVPARLP